MFSVGTRSVAALLVAAATALPARGEPKPGDVITASNAANLNPLIPEELYPYAVEGYDDLKVTITETRDYTPHPVYVEATVKYACQVRLDEKGNLVGYVAGQPFPYSEWAQKATNHRCDLSPDDPQFALKQDWNVNNP